MRSLGAVVWCLQFCHLDHDVLSLRSFSEYTPLDGSTATTDNKAAGEDGHLMSFQHSRMVSEMIMIDTGILDPKKFGFTGQVMNNWVFEA